MRHFFDSIFIFTVTCLLFFGCNRKEAKTIEVKLITENSYNQKIYVDDIPPDNNEISHLDSFSIKDRIEIIRFPLPQKEEELYRIYSKDHRIDIVLINDEPQIELYLNYLDNGNFQFKRSKANISLHSFLSMIKDKASFARAQFAADKDARGIADSLFYAIQLDYRNYVDTVASPAAALYVYNNVDFGNDRNALKSFISRLANRFPYHKRVQELFEKTKSFLAIFEEELEIGMDVPELVLPSKSGEVVSLSSFRGKYVLIDFWASWDLQSNVQEQNSEQVYKKMRYKNFMIVSISLDPEKEIWKQYLNTVSREWIQLIDDKIWMGPAVRSFKFDSIPFNFLIDPSGKIIGKAMYGDSLLNTLEQLVK